MWWKPKRIYLDYAAATPVRPEVLQVMSRYHDIDFANPGSIHTEGRIAASAVEAAREKVGRTLRVRPTDVIFTSGGTESNTVAMRGAVKALMDNGVARSDIEIISTKTEHPSILKTLDDLEHQGVSIVYAPVDEEGLIVLEAFEALLNTKTRLVTVALANSETGVVQDISRIGRRIKAFEKETGHQISFHTDASQAPLWLPCALDALFVDMMTLDAGKCCGPKGMGMLIKRPQAQLSAVTTGGSQEGGLRPGTEPTALIVGAAEALALAQAEAAEVSSKLLPLRNRFIVELLRIPGVVLNGSPNNRLANNINVSIPGFDTEFAVIALDQNGIAASTKSACSGAGGGLSTVVMAMTDDAARAGSTIRFTLGPGTTWSELRRTVSALEDHVTLMSKYAFDPR